MAAEEPVLKRYQRKAKTDPIVHCRECDAEMLKSESKGGASGDPLCPDCWPQKQGIMYHDLPKEQVTMQFRPEKDDDVMGYPQPGVSRHHG